MNKNRNNRGDGVIRKKSNGKMWKPRGKWGLNPTQRPHSTKSGKRGYDRSESRRMERDY